MALNLEETVQGFKFKVPLEGTTLQEVLDTVYRLKQVWRATDLIVVFDFKHRNAGGWESHVLHADTGDLTELIEDFFTNVFQPQSERILRLHVFPLYVTKKATVTETGEPLPEVLPRFERPDLV